MSSYIGKKIIFGVRPEDIGSERAENTGNCPILHARIEVMEPMGAETYLYLDVGADTSCIARIDAHRTTRVGEVLDLAVLMSKAHLFDADTELRII